MPTLQQSMSLKNRLLFLRNRRRFWHNRALHLGLIYNMLIWPNYRNNRYALRRRSIHYVPSTNIDYNNTARKFKYTLVSKHHKMRFRKAISAKLLVSCNDMTHVFEGSHFLYDQVLQDSQPVHITLQNYTLYFFE